MNKNELLAVMKRFGDTQSVLASELGLSRTNLNAKINERGRATFSQAEICIIKKRYGLSAVEIEKIFFDDFVS